MGKKHDIMGDPWYRFFAFPRSFSDVANYSLMFEFAFKGDGMKKSMFVALALALFSCLSACDSVKYSRAEDVSIGEGAELRGQGDLEESKGKAAMSFAQAGEIAADTMRKNIAANQELAIKQQEDLQRLAFQQQEESARLVLQEKTALQNIQMMGVLKNIAVMAIALLVFIVIFFVGWRLKITNERLQIQPIMTTTKSITTVVFPASGKTLFHDRGVPGGLVLVDDESKRLDASSHVIKNGQDALGYWLMFINAGFSHRIAAQIISQLGPKGSSRDSVSLVVPYEEQ